MVFLATSALAAIFCILLTLVSAGSDQLNVDGFLNEVGSTACTYNPAALSAY